MELGRLEDVVVRLVRESNPRIVWKVGFEVFERGGSKLYDWILPIYLITFGCWAHIEILLTRNVNWRLISDIVATSCPVGLIEVINAVYNGQ